MSNQIRALIELQLELAQNTLDFYEKFKESFKNGAGDKIKNIYIKQQSIVDALVRAKRANGI